MAAVKMVTLYWLGVYDVFMAADDMAPDPSSNSASQCNQTGEWKSYNHRPPLLVNKIALDTKPTWNYGRYSCYIMFSASPLMVDITHGIQGWLLHNDWRSFMTKLHSLACICEISWEKCTVGQFGCHLPCVTPHLVFYELISKHMQQLN